MSLYLLEVRDRKIVRRVPLQEARYSLGRDPACDIVFSSDSVSRRHAALVRAGESYRIEDEHSTNRTYVNERPATRRVLVHGDMVSLGDDVTLLVYDDTSGDRPEDLLAWSLSGGMSARDLLRLKFVVDRIIALDNPDNILRVILNDVMALVGAERGFIALVDGQGNLQPDRCVTQHISMAEVRQDSAPYSRSIVRQVIDTRRSVFILNTEDYLHSLSDSIMELSLKAVMCSPLIFGDRLLGVLYVDSGRQFIDFSETDRLFFAILADYAAIAIENARRYDHIQQSNRRLQAGMEESEARYHQLVELVPEAIAVHQGGKLVYVNPAAVKLLKAQRREDLIGRGIFDILHPDYYEQVQQRLQNKVFAQRTAPPIVEKLVCLDGSVIEAEISAAAIMHQQQPAVLVVARDVTERRRMEAILQRSQRLESVGMLAGGIAHDFNNALQSILGNVMLARAHAANAELVAESLERVERAIQRAISLTRQLLTFSRGGAPVTKAGSIRKLVEETVAFALHGSSIAYRLDIADDVPLVEMDADQIHHVIHNLVLNAKQAMPNGGCITVSARPVEVKEDTPIGMLEPGLYVQIVVRDEGTGIPADVLDRVFDPYFTTRPDGAGLGLATCYSIVRKHNGYIEIESEEGQGTAVTFYLPAAPQTAETPADGTAENMPSELHHRILVMDDEETVRDVIVSMLKYLGCEVVAVPHGEAAVAAFEQARKEGQPFDAVMLDLTIRGGMGGEETLKHLRAIDPSVPAIVASGYNTRDVMANPAAYGFQGVLVKPFDTRKMVQVLRDVLADVQPAEAVPKK
ncbi:MAG: PAS domain S-box protein [Chloroflexi bacterium]|nr:MAG: PAS domain S-box protein [Chloroflexota bacterium]